MKFEDGKDGIIDVSSLVEFIGVFVFLKNLDYFKIVKFNLEWGIIYWENGVDLDFDVLYLIVIGERLL